MAVTRLGRKWRIGCRRWLRAGSLKTPIGVLTSLRRSGAATLLATAAFAGMLLVGAGCNTWGSGSYPTQIRPAASETSRLLSNAHYYKLMGRPDAALKEMEEAHQADPNNLKIADALAQNYQELGKFQRAQEIYQEVLARQGSNRALQNNLCFSFYLQGDLTKAESCFKEALERDPGNLAARNNLGLLWCRQSKLAEAQRLWEEAEGAAGAQARMKQALAFLGTKAPANYAKLPEPQPQPQTATQPKPATPAIAASPAKPELAATPTPVKAPTPTPPPAVAPEAGQKVVAKPVETKPTPQSQAVPPLRSATPVTVASPVKPELVAAAPVKASPPAPSAAVAPKVEQKVAAKPAETKPMPQSQAAASLKPTTPVAVAPPVKPALAVPVPVKASSPTPPPAVAPEMEQKVAAKPAEAKLTPQSQAGPPQRPATPVTVASPVKPELAAVPAPVKASPPAPPAAIAAKVEQKVVAKPAEINPSPQSQMAAPLKPVTPVTVAPPVKPVLAAAPVPVKAPSSTPPPAVTPKLEQKVAAKQAPPLQTVAHQQPAAPTILASTGKAKTAKSPTTGKVSSPAPAAKPSRPELKETDCQAPSPPLTALEREKTNIEVLNGNGIRNLARQSGALLYQEAFNVTQIGNHIDFGAKSTVIYYRPGTERVVQGLKWQIFPKARIEASSKLKDGVAIKILLGHDLLDQPLTMARIAASGEPPTAVQMTRTTRVQPDLAAPAAPKVEAVTQAATATSMEVLTAEDLLKTPIEICNGTRVRNLAHKTTSLLSSEGFTVGLIGNYVGVKAKRTVIYYRPKAEKVARTLNSEIFPGARLTPHVNLKRGTAIKVVLGNDFLERPQMLSRLAAENP